MRPAIATRVVSEPLGGSALSRAVQERSLPLSLLPWSPATTDQWRQHAEKVRAGAAPGWYQRVSAALAPGGAAAGRIGKVVAAGGVVVTTGQQAALFGGPLYTLAKALSARALADAVERATGIPAAPVFWAATDDADFLEAASAWVADADGLRELQIRTRPAAGLMMSAVTLHRPEMHALFGELRRACGSAAHAEYLDVARTAFRGGVTLGSAYVALMRAILEPLGIAVFDSSHDAYREAARPALVEALRRAPAIAGALTENTAEIRAAGFEPQVLDERGLSLVFEIAEGAKQRLTVEQSAAAARGARALSPNVLLRPLVERELLPTVAYVAGPGELAYFIQSNIVAGVLERAPLVALPRWSGTVIEPFVDRALRRLGVEWQELRDLHALEHRLAVAGLPPDVAASWKRLRERLHEAIRDFSSTVRSHDLLDAAVVEGLERSLDHRLSRGERRLIAAAKRRDLRARRDIATASSALFPLGSRQERVLNYLPMLARGGDDLMRQLQVAADGHAAGMVRTTSPETAAAV